MKHITVSAAVIRDSSGDILLSRRPEGRHMGGFWEFPGGKVEENESLRQALIRELKEELGIDARIGEKILSTTHREESLSIDLHFFEARIIGGRPQPLDHQEIRWVKPKDLGNFPTPPADLELIRMLA